MKQFLLAIFLCSFVTLGSAQEIEVPQTQIPMITKISASWCPHCGNWGWDFFEGLLENNASKAILMTAHYSGDYRTGEGAAMASNFGIVSQPEFFLGTDKISANSGNFSGMISTVTDNVNSITNETPRAQSGLQLGLQPDGMLRVQARAQFFEKTSGEFYLGLYILERNFVGYQAGQGSTAQHKNIFRGGIGEHDFGDLLAAGSVEADQSFEVEHIFNLNATGFQSDNIEIVAVLWEKVGNKYEYMNANSSTTVELLSANEEVNRRVNLFQVSPNPVSSDATIELRLKDALDQLSLELLSLDGKRVTSVAAPDFLAAGAHRLSWPLNQRLPSGVYLLRLQSAQGVLSRRIVIP